MKKKFMENKKFRLIAMFLVTVLIVTGFSFAWFYIRQIQANEMSVSNFKAEPVCYFDGSENTEGVADEYIENGLIILSTDPDAPNYIGNFRVDVKYTGSGSAYLRVKMVHEYNRGDLAVQHPAEVPYTVDAEKWADNRSNDFCYYYKEELDKDGTINLIQGISDAAGAEFKEMSDDGTVSNIKVAVEADAVQINRYPQIWGIDKLPWK